MKKFIVVVLDGLGIGAMEDVSEVRIQDVGACTLGSILHSRPELRLPNLERLGLMNALGKESPNMRFSSSAIWGRASLMHYGADTFWGHQEIMGTLPKQPKREPFSLVADEVAEILRSAGCKTEFLYPDPSKRSLRILLVEDALTVGDNLEADSGQNYNVTAALDRIAFEKVLEIGRTVRRCVEVSRVICFGNPKIGLERLLDSIEIKNGDYVGVSSTRSGVYGDGYRCIHLGYGVDPSTQIPAILAEKNIPVVLFGKVADIVENADGKSVSWIDTEEVLAMTLGAFEALDRGFICTNVQETDLAGHMQHAEQYATVLEKADRWIGHLMSCLCGDDVLLIMADHGNDPAVGHSHHTREKVPILVYSPRLRQAGEVFLGERSTLSDVGATVAAYFGTRMPENPYAEPMSMLVSEKEND